MNTTQCALTINICGKELFWFPFQFFFQAGGGWWIGGNQIIHFITS
jgi:hypothetical protein